MGVMESLRHIDNKSLCYETVITGNEPYCKSHDGELRDVRLAVHFESRSVFGLIYDDESMMEYLQGENDG